MSAHLLRTFWPCIAIAACATLVFAFASGGVPSARAQTFHGQPTGPSSIVVPAPPPVVARPPSTTDYLIRQQRALGTLLEQQDRTQRESLKAQREAEAARQQAERDRRWAHPETPYDRPVGGTPVPPPKP